MPSVETPVGHRGNFHEKRGRPEITVGQLGPWTRGPHVAFQIQEMLLQCQMSLSHRNLYVPF